MAAPHAFLDVLANVQIRDAYLAGRISIILTPDLETILWTNGAGAHFMGMRTVAEAIGVDSGFDRLTRHQIEAGLTSTTPVRVSGVPKSEVFLVNETDLAPLGHVVFLRSVQGQVDEGGSINLIQGLSDETTAAAVFDLAGDVIQASVNFDQGWFATGELRLILNEAHQERRVKKRLLQKNPSQPIGVLALSQEPAIFLAIAAREDVQEKEKEKKHNFTFNPTILPLYFGWRIGADGRFEEVSGELKQAVGAAYSDITNKDFASLAEAWDMDGDGTLRTLFKSHNAWGGHKVYWPVEGMQTRLEVTFFSLPVYSRTREFVGFRGFAIIGKMRQEAPPSNKSIVGVGLSAQEYEVFSLIGRTLQANLQEKTADEKIVDEEASPSNITEDKDTPSDTAVDVKIQLETLSPTQMHLQPPLTSDFSPLAQWRHTLREEESVAPDATQFELSLLQYIPMAILVYRDEKVLFVSESLLQITGFPTFDSFRVNGILSRILRDWLPKNILQNKEGELLNVRTKMHVIPWLDDKPASMLSFLPDETRQFEHLAQDFQEMQNKAIELSTLLNVVSDGVLVLDRQGIIHSLNEGASRIFKREVEALKGQDFRSFFEPQERQNLDRDFALALEEGYQMHPDGGAFFIGRDGADRDLVLHVNFAPMEKEEGTYLLLRDVSDLHTLSKQAKQASQQAGEARQEKSQYLAQLGHQIRTPLTAVLGLSQLILTEKYGALNNDRYRTYLRDIVNASDHILQLLHYFDDEGTKNDKNKKKFNQEKLALTPILNEVLPPINRMAGQKQILMRTSVTANLAAILCDARACRKIIRNLLGCSLHLTPAGGQIIISGQNHAPEGVLLRIRDSGAGLSAQDKATIMTGDHSPIWPDDEMPALQEKNVLPVPVILAQTKKLAEANGAHFRLHSEPGRGMLVEIVFMLGQ